MDRALRDLLRTERRREQIEERRRRNALRRQAEESVSLRDVLAELAASAQPVAMTTAASGPTPSGAICELGRDYVALRDGRDVVHLVPLAQVAAAAPIAPITRTELGANLPGVAHPVPPDALDLAERLRELAMRRTEVCAHTPRGAVSGRLRQVGADVLVVTDPVGAPVAIVLGQLAVVEIRP
jgi:hypothetical protein